MRRRRAGCRRSRRQRPSRLLRGNDRRGKRTESIASHCGIDLDFRGKRLPIPVEPLQLHMARGPRGLSACSIHATIGPEPELAIVGSCRFVLAPVGVGVLTTNSPPLMFPFAWMSRPLIVRSLLSVHATKKCVLPSAAMAG